MFSLRSKIFEKIDCVPKSSKSEPSSRFFGRLKNFANFDSIDSIVRSIRSILRPKVVVDHLRKGANESNRTVLDLASKLEDNLTQKGGVCSGGDSVDRSQTLGRRRTYF